MEKKKASYRASSTRIVELSSEEKARLRLAFQVLLNKIEKQNKAIMSLYKLYRTQKRHIRDLEKRVLRFIRPN